MFERSILISIFLTEVFIFYQEQFAALTGLAANILILIALKFMIEREEGKIVYNANPQKLREKNKYCIQEWILNRHFNSNIKLENEGKVKDDVLVNWLRSISLE